MSLWTCFGRSKLELWIELSRKSIFTWYSSFLDAQPFKKEGFSPNFFQEVALKKTQGFFSKTSTGERPFAYRETSRITVTLNSK